MNRLFNVCRTDAGLNLSLLTCLCWYDNIGEFFFVRKYKRKIIREDFLFIKPELMALSYGEGFNVCIKKNADRAALFYKN